MSVATRRLIHVGISLLAVTASYWLYALLLVPQIEPSPEGEAHADSGRFVLPADELLDRRLAELAPLFPRRTSLLRDAKMLESEEVKLLLHHYKNLGDGRVLIQPCVIVFTPNQQGQEIDLSRAMVLEAPEGAVLQFDQSLDLRMGRIGRLMGGRLVGPIVLRSEGASPRADDNFLLTTRDVNITEHRLWTTSPVEFSWGRHRGRGAGMEVRLKSNRTTNEFAKEGMSTVAVERFVLRHVHRIHLHVADRTARQPEDSRNPAAPLSGESTAELESVELTCQGPLVFSPDQKSIDFSERVEVTLGYRDGPEDHITSDHLSIFLTSQQEAAEKLAELARQRRARRADDLANMPRSAVPAGSGSTPSTGQPPEKEPDALEAIGSDWVLEGIKASGQPVVATLSHWDAEGRGELLEYNALAKSLLIDGESEVTLRQGEHEVTAPRVRYRPDETGGPLGLIVADGPGRIVSRVEDQSESFTAAWQEALQVRPFEGEQVISLTGGATMSLGKEGSVSAGEVWCWLQEAKRARSDGSTLEPDRLLARYDVQLRSPQLDTDTEQLEVWFVEGSEDASPRPQPPVAQRADPEGMPADGGPVEDANDRQRHFRLTGRLVRVEFERSDEGGSPRSLMIDGNVRLEETRTTEPDEDPVMIVGEHVEVTNASRPSATAVVTGSPARIEGRDLKLSGRHIFMDRFRNQLTVDGIGSLSVPVSRDLEGNSLSEPRPLDIDWQQGMSLDGQQGVIHGGVIARTDRQRLLTETLEMYFDRPLPFRDPDEAAAPKIERLRCLGGVTMENRSVAADGKPGLDRFQLPELRLNLKTGLLQAPGPGRFVSLRRGANAWGQFSLTGNGGTPPPENSGAAASPQSGSQLAAQPPQPAPKEDPQRPFALLAVDFRDEFLGNIFQEKLVCRGRVKVAYGRWAKDHVDTIPDDPAALGERGMVVYSRELSIVRMRSPLVRDRRYWELQASGNVTVEGQVYTARGERLAFDESKQLLILEGDGRSDAQLFRQEYAGASMQTTAAQRIVYSHATNTYQLYDARVLELSGLTGSSPLSSPTSPNRK